MLHNLTAISRKNNYTLIKLSNKEYSQTYGMRFDCLNATKQVLRQIMLHMKTTLTEEIKNSKTYCECKGVNFNTNIDLTSHLGRYCYMEHF